MQELCGKVVCDLKYSLRMHTHKAASEAFNLLSDKLLFSSLTLMTFFNCCFSVCQMVGNAFLSGI